MSIFIVSISYVLNYIFPNIYIGNNIKSIINMVTFNSNYNDTINIMFILGSQKCGTSSIMSLLDTFNDNNNIKISKGNNYEMHYFDFFLKECMPDKSIITNNLFNNKLNTYLTDIMNPNKCYWRKSDHKVVNKYLNYVFHSNNRQYYFVDKDPEYIFFPHLMNIVIQKFVLSDTLNYGDGNSIKLLALFRDPYDSLWSGVQQFVNAHKYYVDGKSKNSRAVESYITNIWLTMSDSINLLINAMKSGNDDELIHAWINVVYKHTHTKMINHHILRRCYYPQLLYIKKVFKKSGKLDKLNSLRIMNFKYYKNHDNKALFLIKCWMKYGLDNSDIRYNGFNKFELCHNKYENLNETKMYYNSKSQSKISSELINIMSPFYDVCNAKTNQFIKENPSLVIGKWVNL